MQPSTNISYVTSYLKKICNKIELFHNIGILPKKEIKTGKMNENEYLPIGYCGDGFRGALP